MVSYFFMINLFFNKEKESLFLLEVILYLLMIYTVTCLGSTI